MTAFARFGTRFSISTAAPAKVAKAAKVDAGEAELSQLSQVSRQAIPEPKNPPHHPLMHPAARIAASIADGAEREDDPDGWLVLVLPDGRRQWWTTSPEPDGWCCSTCHPQTQGLVRTVMET